MMGVTLEGRKEPQQLVSTCSEWSDLQTHSDTIKSTHLRDLLQDDDRCEKLFVSKSFKDGESVDFDFCRSKVTSETMDKLNNLANKANLREKRDAMFSGEKINETENRAVLHTALRAKRDQEIMFEGKNVVEDVHEVLDRIKIFSEEIRSGKRKGCTGKDLTNVVCIGIGGSYLSVEFVHEALKTDKTACKAAEGRQLRFLANVDPIDVERALSGLDAEETLVVIISKTFTTAETMLNAKTVRNWLNEKLQNKDAISKHVVAVSTALEKTSDFGIDKNNVFGFWDWVGGRFSLCSAVGMLPLALQYGAGEIEKILDGANTMDRHFKEENDFSQNLPVVLGLLNVWNNSFMGYDSCAVLPYCQALLRFVAHIQQLDMESNGKRVTMDGETVNFKTGSIHFGEPGTNGQHSFYQLLHQGRVVPAEFIAFAKSQNPVDLSKKDDTCTVSNHDELMSNFFAQPDALALGKTPEQLRKEGVKEELVAHKTFPGDRPSVSLLLPECNAFYIGLLLALYEHRTAVQGWVWGVNSFDQWGVELGKVLGVNVRNFLKRARAGDDSDDANFIKPTSKLMKRYLQG